MATKAETRRTQMTVFEDGLTAMGPKIQAALPPHVTLEKMNRTVMMALQSNDKLLECNRNSLYTATLACASSGLLPDGREAALVPFKSDVQFIPMVAGLMKMMRNSGDLKDITAECVRENDQFEYELGDNAFIRHVPKLGGDRGDIILTYCVVHTKDGGTYREFMDEEQIASVRSVSRAGAKNTGPWKDWPEEMRKKSVIRRIAKRVPMSTDMLEMVMKGDDTEFPAGTTDAGGLDKTDPTRLRSAVAEAEIVSQSASGDQLPEDSAKL